MDHKQTSSSPQAASWVGLAIVGGVLLIGLLAGFFYLKSQSNQGASSGAPNGKQMLTGPGPGPSGGGSCANGQPKSMLMINGQQIETCGMPSSGQVTNIGSDSITMTDDATNTAKTFKITSATSISKKGGTATLAEITTSDKVAIVPNTDDPTVAGYVILNPPQQQTSM